MTNQQTASQIQANTSQIQLDKRHHRAEAWQCQPAASMRHTQAPMNTYGRCLETLHACRGYDGRLRLGALPVSLFCNGHTYFVQRLHESLKVDPYVVHTVFQFSGTPGKRHRLREDQLWNVSPSSILIVPSVVNF